MLSLIIQINQNPPITLPLASTPLRLGRHPECEIQLSDQKVSRFHAELLWSPNKKQLWLRNLASTTASPVKRPNPIWLNGQVILYQTVIVPAESYLQLGETQLTLTQLEIPQNSIQCPNGHRIPYTQDYLCPYCGTFLESSGTVVAS